MGYWINLLRKIVEKVSGSNPIKLTIGGAFLTTITILSSGMTGWLIERIYLSELPSLKLAGSILLIICLSSTIATKSLYIGIFNVLNSLNESSKKQKKPVDARKKLSYIVGRDVKDLDSSGILRATAETASENSIDGIFAPLFWMSIGLFIWKISFCLPGPLALALMFKSSSTIDSMIGYKKGKLKWLGLVGAKIDDYLTWIPCRLVLITLPLSCRSWNLFFKLTRKAINDGSLDESPNSGISEAIYAYCAEVKMGGSNKYNGIVNIKPILAKGLPEATPKSIKKILNLTLRLEFIWLALILVIN